MCGIAGILKVLPDNERGALDRTLEVLRSELRHRGPDDAGTWHSACGKTHFVYTRLAILDLSAAGQQPMTTADRRFTITFNGEIYNFRELRSDLERAGVQFRTGTDTEVLLALFERHGTDCVGKLRGMFAFCIWDAQEERAFLARDPLGIKPLYYSLQDDGSLVFASELKALRRSGLVGTAVDGQAVLAYLETGSVPEPLTLLKGVFCLRAGCWLQWRKGTLQEQCYWRLRFDRPETNMSAGEAKSLVREALLDSVRQHFVSDVPVGIFLSGGIDSTALLALSREVGQNDIRTFSIGVEDAALDESAVARETAARFGTAHHELRLSGEMAEESFAEFLRCGDQPRIDGFNTFTVARFGRREGMKVVLSGLGGDEMFAGYPSFTQVPKLARLHRFAHAMSPIDGLVGAGMERWGRSPRARRLGTMLRRPPGIASAYRAFRGVFSGRVARELVRRYVADPPSDIAGYAGDPALAADEQDQVSELELSRYMRNQLLKDSDMMSMAHGLELRVPLVDQRLFEAVSRVPAALRLRRGKAMLLEAVPEVPHEIAQARKRGFVFPFETWLQESCGEEFTAVRRALPAPNPTWYQGRSLFLLERWLKQG